MNVVMDTQDLTRKEGEAGSQPTRYWGRGTGPGQGELSLKSGPPRSWQEREGQGARLSVLFPPRGYRKAALRPHRPEVKPSSVSE